MPGSLILDVPLVAVQYAMTILDSVLELTLVPAPVRPPEGAPAVALAFDELALVSVGLFTCPFVEAPALFLIELELADVVVTTGEVQLAHALQLPIFELTQNDLLRVFVVAQPLAMRPIDLHLADVDDIGVLVELGRVEGSFGRQHHRRGAFDSQELFKFGLHIVEFPADIAGLVAEVIEVELCLLEHEFLGVAVQLQLRGQPAHQNVECPVHLLDGLELAVLELLHQVVDHQKRLLLGMEIILFRDVGLDDSADALVEIGQYPQQVLELLVDAADQVGHFVSLVIPLRGCLEAVLQELGHIDGVVVLVGPADGEALGADHALGLALGVNADKSWCLLVQVAVVRLDELFECPGEHLSVGHVNKFNVQDQSLIIQGVSVVQSGKIHRS